jgi:threonine dehydratase
MHLDPQRIRDARSLLARHFGPTRIARAASLSSPGRDVFLKLETELPTGSFKVRGALYALSRHVPTTVGDGLKAVPYDTREVVCASTGNHGAAVAWAAQQLGVAATVFLPSGPNPVKAARILALGARLVESGRDLSDAIDAAEAHARRASAFFLHDASDPDVPAGTATIGVEIVEQLPETDVIYVPMGDTALVRGVAAASKQLRPSIVIVGVVADQAPAYLLSWQRAERSGAGGSRLGSDDVVETATCDTIADGLAIRRPLAQNVAAIRELVDDVVAVSEAEMIAAIQHLYTREQVLAEPAGAAATAAFLQRRDNPVGRVLPGPPRATTTVLLVTGRNIAPELRATCRIA